MKPNKAIVRIIAVMATLAMLFSFAGCVKAYNNDPTIVKCGDVKLGLQRFMSIYQNSDYYQYYQQGYIDAKTYTDYCLNELTSYGVQLNQAKKQGIKLTDEEEAKLQSDVDDQIKSYLDENYASKIDSAITDAQAKYDAELKELTKDLKSAGSSFKKYRAELEENLRNSALINKLRDTVIGDITVNNDDVQKYYDDNLNTEVTPSSFYTSFTNYISGSSTSIPAYMPVYTGEEETTDEPEATEDANASTTPKLTEYDQLFSVIHTLIKFTEAPGDDVTDLAAYGAEDKTFAKLVEFAEEKAATLDAEGFMEHMCFNSDICQDPGMEKDAYQFFGYPVCESLLSQYYEGFGEAAMMLKYPDWEPKAEETTEETTEEKPEIDHNYTRMTLKDGTEIMRVYTSAGVHYIMLNPNDWNAMYGEDGKLMVPIYEGDEVKKAGDEIVTTAGNISQELFDKINEALSHVGDSSAEGYEQVTCKSVYDYLNKAALTVAQNDVFTTAFNGWKEATKIKVNNSALKAFTGVL